MKKSVDVRESVFGGKEPNRLFHEHGNHGDAFRAVPWPEGAPPMSEVPNRADGSQRVSGRRTGSDRRRG